MSSFLTGMQLALGAAVVLLALGLARQAVRHWHDHGRKSRVNSLAHPEPVCLVRHQHKGRELADLFRRECTASDADLAAAMRVFRYATRLAVARHGGHAADVLLCDLDGAVREFQSINRTDVPHA